MSTARRKKALPYLLYCAVMVVVFAAMAAHCGLFLAPWQHKTGVWQPRGETAPLALVLAGPQLTLRREAGVLWQSDPGWRVQDYAVGDLNHDGADELLLLVWRRGNYGPSRPFWVAENETAHYTQHIFIYRWSEAKTTVVPLWMSSRLAPEVKRWQLTPAGDLQIITPAGETTLWGWRSWGLERVDTPAVILY